MSTVKKVRVEYLRCFLLFYISSKVEKMTEIKYNRLNVIRGGRIHIHPGINSLYYNLESNINSVSSKLIKLIKFTLNVLSTANV